LSIGTMEDNLIDLQVEIPGRPHARYEHDFNTGGLRLVGVEYPPERSPADLCAVIDTLADEQAPLSALLLGNLAHPAGCRVSGRMLGGVEIRAGSTVERHIVAVADEDSHFASVATYATLSPERRESLELFFRLDGRGADVAVTWLGPEFAQVIVHEARQRFRLAAAESRDQTPLGPAWKPINRETQPTRSDEAERHTAAEYAFYALPYRFQKYVEEYLALNERVLYSIHRPAMRSGLKRKFLVRERLEEGVLVLSDQQVSQVTELMPPDSAGIRYGFIARSGVPERLEAVELLSLARDTLGLALTWRASGGLEKMVLEFPAELEDEAGEALKILERWLPQNAGRNVQRATPPEPPETWPPLADPAAHAPEDTEPLAARLESALAQMMCSGETLLARCLLPGWLAERSAASLVAVTAERLLVVPDPQDPKAAQLGLEVPLADISSLEFSSTLVMTYLKLFVPEGERVTSRAIEFGKTLSAMNDCYLALRQTLATVPVQRKEVTHA
jgi:inorganic pyrophosphatase